MPDSLIYGSLFLLFSRILQQYQTPPLPISEEERAQQKITAVIPTKTCQMAYRFPTTPASELHMMTNSRAILITTHDVKIFLIFFFFLWQPILPQFQDFNLFGPSHLLQDEQNEWSIALAFASRIVIYVAILGGFLPH